MNKIELIEGDIRDLSHVKDAVKEVDYVIHLAAISSIKKSMDDPKGTNEVNIDGTLNVLNASAEAKVKKLVFASSCAVCGNLDGQKAVETISPQPLSPYAEAKLKGEVLCQQFSAKHNLQTISLRLFNVFGPRQDPSSEYSAVIPKFITMILKGEKPTIYGDGKQTRDFVYINNVLKAITLACRSTIENGGVFNIASGQSKNLLELVGILNEILKTDVSPIFAKARHGEVKHSNANISKAITHLKYEPSISFVEGLEKTIHYYLKEIKGRNKK